MSEKSPNNENGEEKNTEYWTNRALDKVLSFLPDIDQDLRVSVERREIHPNKWESYEGITLHFYHKGKPSIEWTMDIGENEDYIDNRLETVVRKIYTERITETN